MCAGVCKLSRASEKTPSASLPGSCVQNQNSLEALLLHVLGPVISSMGSYQDITQLVLFLRAAPRCHNVIDEQKEPERKTIGSKEMGEKAVEENSGENPL